MINIKTDSRNVKINDTFIAIKGHTVDGHDYIKNALLNGATKIISEKKCEVPKNVELLVVKDTQKYLEEYLENSYQEIINKLDIVGITGTNGKTTTAFLTYQLLRKENINCAYIGTIGFYINDNYYPTLNTTPDILTTYNYLLEAIEKKVKVVILEASSIGLVENRLKGIKFKTALFTNLTHDHLDYHKTMENYLDAKKILFNNLKEDGTGIINIDDEYSKFFTAPKIMSFGFKKSDVHCIKYDEKNETIDIVYNNNTYHTNNPIPGNYNVSNLLGAISILLSLNYDIDEILNCVPNLNPPSGRMNIINYNDNKIVIDYAHTPDGFEKIISYFYNNKKSKLYIVFGCPGNRDRKKRPIMAKIAEKYADYVVVTDDDPHNEDEDAIIKDIILGFKNNNYEVIIDRKHAIQKAFSMLNKNDTLLILGKGHEDVIIKKNERIPHNDTKWVNELVINN